MSQPRLRTILAALLALVCAVAVIRAQVSAPQPAPDAIAATQHTAAAGDRPPSTRAQVAEWMKTASAWGSGAPMTSLAR